jgi:hypothetical protein
LIEAEADPAGEIEQAARVAQAVTLGRQLLHFARLRREGLDRLELERDEGLALAAAALGLAHGADASDDRLEPGHLGGELDALIDEAREAVEVAEVRRGIGERDALVLRGDVGELGREGRELARGAEATVEVGTRPARRLDDAANHQVPVAGDAAGFERGEHTVRPAHVEQGLDLGLVRARAHLLGVGAAAEHQRERADDDRFARAGLAGEDVEAAIERKLEGVHQDEILDPEGDEHGARSIETFASIVDDLSARSAHCDVLRDGYR